MKKILLFSAAVFLCTISTTAQLTKGNWLVGGSGSFYSYSEDYSTTTFNQAAKYTNIDIAASVGYFIIDKFTIGLRPSFSSYKGKVVSASVGSGGSTNSYRVAIGPFARYYFLKIDKQFNVLTDIGYQFGINNWQDGYPAKGKYNSFSLMGGG